MQDREHNYTYQSMHRKREFGVYWYSGVWQVLRPVLVGLASVIVVIGLLGAVWTKVYNDYLAPVDASSSEPVSFEVASGQSLTRVANNLESAGLIRSHTFFKYYCDFSGFSQKIQSGTYVLNRSMSMSEIADQLTRGDGNPLVRNITMIPGWTVEDLAARLVEQGVLDSPDEFLRLCRTGTEFSDYYYIAEVLESGRAANRRYVLEGYLSPNTYEVYTNSEPKEIIRRLLSQTEKTFPADYLDRAEELGCTMDDIITLASLIEKEGKEPDFTRVSAVFHNRLRQGMPLGSDVTIHYITGVRRMSLNEADLNADSPYNTYTHKGLPPGPICAPSREAILAALYPDETFLAENYLYFCAKEPESGELYFSRTLEEHNRAVEQYRPSWDAYDKKRGID